MYYDFVSRFHRPAVARSAPARPAVYAVDSYTDPYPAVVAPVVLASAVMTPVALVSVALTPSSRAASKSLSRYPNPARFSRMPHIARNASGDHGTVIRRSAHNFRYRIRATHPEPRNRRPNRFRSDITPPQLRKAAYRSQFIHTDRIFSTKITNLIVLRTLRAKNGSDFGGSGRNAAPQPPDSPTPHPRRNRR